MLYCLQTQSPYDSSGACNTEYIKRSLYCLQRSVTCNTEYLKGTLYYLQRQQLPDDNSGTCDTEYLKGTLYCLQRSVTPNTEYLEWMLYCHRRHNHCKTAVVCLTHSPVKDHCKAWWDTNSLDCQNRHAPRCSLSKIVDIFAVAHN